MRNNHRKSWSEDDISKLKEYYDSGLSIESISKMLGRTKRTIHQRITVEKLANRNPFKKWTEEEINIIKEWYPLKGCGYCSRKLGRSHDSVWQKASQCKIEFTSVEDTLENNKASIIRANREGVSTREIAKTYGCRTGSVTRAFHIWKVNIVRPRRNYHASWSGYKEIGGTYRGSIKKSAKERGFNFDIKIEDVWDLFIKQDRKCALSGVYIQFNPGTLKTKSDQTASLDRINSNLGYTIDNIQWVHKSVNHMKMQLSNEDFINFCTLVAKNRGTI